MDFGTIVVLGSVVVAAAPSGERSATPRCVATEMIAAVTADVPAGADGLHARLEQARDEAGAAEAAEDRRELRRLCARALLGFADVAPEVLGGERGTSEVERARKLAVELSLANGDYVGPLPPAPVVRSPGQKWEDERRRLVTHTAVSGTFFGIGVLLATVPWIVLSSCRDPHPGFGCGEGMGAFALTGVGVSIGVISAIPLIAWSYKLHKHKQARPPEPTHPRYRVRVGSGLRIDF